MIESLTASLNRSSFTRGKTWVRYISARNAIFYLYQRFTRASYKDKGVSRFFHARTSKPLKLNIMALYQTVKNSGVQRDS